LAVPTNDFHDSFGDVTIPQVQIFVSAKERLGLLGILIVEEKDDDYSMGKTQIEVEKSGCEGDDEE
jgi:hypothetical protein